MSETPIEAAIAALAKDFADAGRVLDVDRAAFGLSLAYPESSLTTEEIRSRIVEAAERCGTATIDEGATGGSGKAAASPLRTSTRNSTRRSPLRPRSRPRRGTSGRTEDASRLSPRN